VNDGALGFGGDFLKLQGLPETGLFAKRVTGIIILYIHAKANPLRVGLLYFRRNGCRPIKGRRSRFFFDWSDRPRPRQIPRNR